MGNQGANEGKINQRGDHLGVAALYISIGQDVYKTLLELVM